MDFTVPVPYKLKKVADMVEKAVRTAAEEMLVGQLDNTRQS
jgi:hypothetical protein